MVSPELPSPAEQKAMDTAQSTAQALGADLKSRLQATLKAEGPAAALSVCSLEAQPITQKASAPEGVRVGRASLRTRNPKNTPPDWVGAWLTEHGERKVTGLSPSKSLGQDPEGRPVGRFLAPIGVQGPCLLCHGPKQSLLPEVQALLAKRYPEDQATGYALGDLRGVIWAESRVE